MRSQIVLATTILLSALSNATAFQLSMVSSSSPRTFSNANPLKSSSSSVLSAPFSTAASALAGNFNLSSSLISQLAILALKVRLAEQQSVDCDVTAKPTDLLVGRVGPVTVTGRGWQSGLGLTCRAIEATVDSCELDVRRVLVDRKLVLTTPAKGHAMIALNAVDFGNFITHPRMRPPTLSHPSSQDSSPIRFLKEGTQIDPSSGAVSFDVEFGGDKWHCLLKRGNSKTKNQPNAVVAVRPTNSVDGSSKETALQLSKALGRFFNEMVFELDGTLLSFRDMMVTGKGQSPVVMLSLSIQVHKFPSRDLAF